MSKQSEATVKEEEDFKCIGNRESIIHSSFASWKAGGVLVGNLNNEDESVIHPFIYEELEEFIAFENNTAAYSDNSKRYNKINLNNVSRDESSSSRSSGKSYSGPLVLVGPSGVGKSAILAKWYADMRQRKMSSKAVSRDTFLFWHVIGVSSRRSMQVSYILRRLIRNLKEHFNIKKEYEDEEYDEDKLPWLFPRVLDNVARRGGTAIIILDGLHRVIADQTDFSTDTAAGLHWLPTTFPSGIKVILTTTTSSSYGCSFSDRNSVLEEVIKTRETRKKKLLLELQRRGWMILELKTCNVKDHKVKSFIQIFSKTVTLSSYNGLQLLPTMVDDIIEHPQSDNIQFIYILLCSLAHAGNLEFDLIDCLHKWINENNTTSDLYQSILGTFEEGNHPNSSMLQKALHACNDARNICSKDRTSHRTGGVTYLDLTSNSDQSTPQKLRQTSHRTAGVSCLDLISNNDKNSSQKLKRFKGLKRASFVRDSEYSGGSGDENPVNDKLLNDVDSVTMSDIEAKTSSFQIYLTGGKLVNGLKELLGDALVSLYIARHGLRVDELIDVMLLKAKTRMWQRDNESTTLLAEIKLLNKIITKRSRLIDIFRSFDVDGNGTLSHEEFQQGLFKLGLELTNADIEKLTKVVDKNNDGEICYEEALLHFERKARQSFHQHNGIIATRNKDMLNNFGGHRASIIEAYDVRIEPDIAAFLISTLVCLGVLYLPNDNVLILCPENDSLRDAVWKKYIISVEREEDWHALLISYFIDQPPSFRRSEELPWHLFKCRRWTTLKNTLIDLRTFDIMYNKDNLLKCELLSWLVLLTGGNNINMNSSRAQTDCSVIKMPPFDVVDELNRAVELWYQGMQPPHDILATMILNIGNFLAWFSEISKAAVYPPFLRPPTDADKLKELGILSDIEVCIGIEQCKQLKAFCSSGHTSKFSSKSLERFKELVADTNKRSFYYVERWFWIQWPWLALNRANTLSSSLSALRASNFTTSHALSLTKKLAFDEVNRYWKTKSNRGGSLATTKLSVCDRAHSAMRNAVSNVERSELRLEKDEEGWNSDVVHQLDMIPRAKAKLNQASNVVENNGDSILMEYSDHYQHAFKDTFVIDSNKLFPSNDMNNHRHRELTKLSRLRDAYDKIVVEARKKEVDLQVAKRSMKDLMISKRKFRQMFLSGEEQITTKQNRLTQIEYGLKCAVELRDVYSTIAKLLESNKPSDEKKHIMSLEKQVELTRQQYDDLLKKLRDISRECEIRKTKDLSKLSESINFLKKKREETSSQLQSERCAFLSRKNITPLNEKVSGSINPSDRRTLFESFLPRSTSIPPSIFTNLTKTMVSSTTKINLLSKAVSDPATLSQRAPPLIGKGQDKIEADIHCLDIESKLRYIFDMVGSLEPEDIARAIVDVQGLERRFLSQKRLNDEQIRALQNEISQAINILDDHRILDNSCSQIDTTKEMKDLESYCCKGEMEYTALVQELELSRSTIQRIRMGIVHIVAIVCNLFAETDNGVFDELTQARRQSEFNIRDLGAESDVKSLYLAEQKFAWLLEITKHGNENENNNMKECDEENRCKSATKIRVKSKAQSEEQNLIEINHLFKEQDKIAEREERGSLAAIAKTDKEKLMQFIAEALKTSDTRNKQRVANLVTNSKQNERADRGVVIESLLS